MFEKIDYFPPYFNDANALRKAFEKKYPDYDFVSISAVMIGVLSVYVPEDKFNKIIAEALSEAK